MAFCNKCGTEAPDGSGFCHTCRTPIGNTDKKAQHRPEQDNETQIRNKPVYGVINLEDLPKGHVIDDRYEVKTKIGQSGFGAVYQAYDRNMKVDKALKVLPEAITSDKEAMEILGKEAARVVRLNHTNIVSVFDFQRKDAIKYIDMEYVDGRSLTDIKLDSPSKKLSESEVRKLAGQIATGLSYAHSKNIIHKDIKPQNILLSKNGKIKIMDFGISETVRSAMNRIANSSSTRTLLYMAPEQIKGMGVGQEADIYSFGISLYELLSGKPPFNKGAIEHQIINEKPAMIDGVSAEMNAILQKCLAKDYTKRFRSFNDVLNSLNGTPAKERLNAVSKNESITNHLKWLVPGGVLSCLLAVFLLTGNSDNKPIADSADNTVNTIPVKQKKPSNINNNVETRHALSQNTTTPNSEADYNRKISNLDNQIRTMQKRLKNGTPESGDSLKAITNLIVEQTKENEKLAGFIRNKKTAEAKGKKEENERFIAQLKEDIKDYNDVVASEYGENMKSTAWKTLTGKYPERTKSVDIGDTHTLLYGFAVLNINTIPSDADIKLLNTQKTFSQGMKLKAGNYRIKVEAKNYIGKEENIALKAGKTKNIDVSLVKYPRLYVTTEPADTTIKLLDTRTVYEYGVSLKPGEYRLQVNSEVYIGKEVSITLKAGETKNIDVSLMKYARLYVSTDPSKATIKLLNTNSKYKKGMTLKPGTYTVEVSANGCIPKKETVELGAGDVKKAKIKLERGFKNSTGMKFFYIQPGSFNMGSNTGELNEKPVHRVTLSKGFYMQTTEVTQEQWRSVMDTNPSSFKNCDDCPVERVSWNEAKDFIRKLNSKEGTSKYRLPTEAEWEYACRAGSDTDYTGGNNIDVMGWYRDNSGRKSHSVAGKKANAWGLYDMHGNVWEWCEDRFGKYKSGHFNDPAGSSWRSKRVRRGGSYRYGATDCRSANRNSSNPDSKSSRFGFRLSRTP